MPSRPAKRIAALLVVVAMLGFAGQAGFRRAHAGSTYVVQPGDSLWAISRSVGTTVDQLAQANHMRPSDLLLIGRHLTIPAAGSAGSSGATATSGHSTGAHSASAHLGTAASSSSASNSRNPSSSPNPSNRSGASSASPSVQTNPNFCATFTPTAAPRGVLPGGLSADPGRLALRPLFVRWANRYGISPALSEAIAWQESGWQAGVVSSAQAVGIGQLLPSTADFVSQLLIGSPLDIHAVSDNVQMSARYLAYLQGQEGGNLCRTIAAYYEGSVNMARYGVFNETQPYVTSVEALIPRFQ